MLAGKLPTGSVGGRSTDGDRIHGRPGGLGAGARARRTDGRHGHARSASSRANRSGPSGVDATDADRGRAATVDATHESATRARDPGADPRHDRGPRSDGARGSTPGTDAARAHAGASRADSAHGGAPSADHPGVPGTDRGPGGPAAAGPPRADSPDHGGARGADRRRFERRLAAEREERRAVIDRYERLLAERTAAVRAARDPPDESGGPTASARAWFRRAVSRIELSV